jgi:peptidoglycan hydrolase-like protein with peptidoglycan-binding domain
MDQFHRRAVDEVAVARATDPTSAPGVIEHLQQTAGNAAVAQLFARTQRLDAGPETADETESLDGEPAPAERPMIRVGSTGPSVVEAQARLNVAGSTPPLAPDAIFGPMTLAATRAFQEAHSLVADGIVGPLTWSELLAAQIIDPTTPALFSFGDDGPDVGVLEQRLNAAGMAQPFLPVDATYDVAVLIAVARFQFEIMGALPTGAVDQLTWDALEILAPGGGVDNAGDETHVASGEAEARGVQVAGTSLHQVVGPGGLRAGPAVEEFQQKLNIVRLVAGIAPIAEDGAWGPETRTATRGYQTSVGLAPATGIGSLATWARLDQDAPATTVGFVDRQWLQEQGGLETGLTGASASRYSWALAGNVMLVSAKVDFRNNPPASSWFGFVTTTWNHYKAVSDTGDEVAIDFQLTQGAGGDANVVNVATGTGRANAGQWFLADTDAANTVPHEFGHLIGLRDEYQVHPGDYREITGNEPPVGETDGPTDDTPPNQIAQEIQAAMLVHDDDAAHTATVDRGITMGAFAQRVVAEYQALPAVAVAAKPAPNPLAAFTTSRTDIAGDLFKSLPPTPKQYETIQVLTYSTGSTMGDPSRVIDPHDHGVQPRHVQEFCDLIAAARGGTWSVVQR